MKKESINTFNEGLNFDLNPITTPNNILTDCVNGTFVTFNGDELALQNDAGNTKIETSISESVKLSDGYYPLAMKEYGGILYIVSAKKGAAQNGSEDRIEFGCYPSPESSGKTSNQGKLITFSVTTDNPNKTYQWIKTGNKTCQLDEYGKNTGMANIEYMRQYSTNGSIWINTDELKVEAEESLSTCALPAYMLAICVNSSAYDIPSEQIIPYSENSSISVQTPTKAGTNYVFISAPSDKILNVKNTLNIDITNSFTVVGVDNRPLYKTNKIYKKNDGFNTSLSANYIIKLN